MAANNREMKTEPASRWSRGSPYFVLVPPSVISSCIGDGGCAMPPDGEKPTRAVVACRCPNYALQRPFRYLQKETPSGRPELTGFVTPSLSRPGFHSSASAAARQAAGSGSITSADLASLPLLPIWQVFPLGVPCECEATSPSAPHAYPGGMQCLFLVCA